MKIKNLLFKNKKIITLVVVFTFLILAISGYGWHFYKEEIDLFYAASKVKSFHDLCVLFLSGNVSGNAHPSNYAPPQLTFLTSFYRPVLFVFAFLEYTLIGMKPYIHYLLSVGLHCCNIPLMFYFLSLFLKNQIALMCTLLFVLHPAFATWIGNANMQQYTISTTCILILIILIKKYLEQHNKKFLIWALVLFAITLFIRETIIVAPIIIIWLGLLKIINWHKTITLAYTFTIATLPYLAAKLAIYPFKLNTNQATSFTNLSAKTSLFFLQAQLFVYDFLSISWFPDGYPKLKVIVILIFLAGIIYLFFKSSHKRYIISAFGCLVLLLWPAIMIGYFVPSRFFYEATPAYLLTLGLLFESIIQHAHIFYIISILISSLIFCNFCYTPITINKRKTAPAKFYKAIEKLRNHHKIIYNTPLCFFGLTDQLNWTGLAQQLWLYKINNNHPIYIFQQLPICENTDITFITWNYTKNEFFVFQQPTSNESFASTYKT